MGGSTVALVRGTKVGTARPIAKADEEAMKRRIFDHLDDVPESRRFSRVAWEMWRSAWWITAPVRDEPAPVVGEINGGER